MISEDGMPNCFFHIKNKYRSSFTFQNIIRRHTKVLKLCKRGIEVDKVVMEKAIYHKELAIDALSFWKKSSLTS